MEVLSMRFLGVKSPMAQALPWMAQVLPWMAQVPAQTAQAPVERGAYLIVIQLVRVTDGYHFDTRQLL